jgi:hypothetical protein
MKLRDMLRSVGQSASSTLILHLLDTASRIDFKRWMSNFRTLGTWQLRAIMQTTLLFYIFQTTSSLWFVQHLHSDHKPYISVRSDSSASKVANLLRAGRLRVDSRLKQKFLPSVPLLNRVLSIPSRLVNSMGPLLRG